MFWAIKAHSLKLRACIRTAVRRRKKKESDSKDITKDITMPPMMSQLNPGLLKIQAIGLESGTN